MKKNVQALAPHYLKVGHQSLEKKIYRLHNSFVYVFFLFVAGLKIKQNQKIKCSNQIHQKNVMKIHRPDFSSEFFLFKPPKSRPLGTRSGI